MDLKTLLKPTIVRFSHSENNPSLAKRVSQVNKSLRQMKGDIINQEQVIERNIKGKRTCLCFRSNYSITIRARLNKQIFYPNEKIVLKIQIDNSGSQSNIKKIHCSLKQTIAIKKHLREKWTGEKKGESLHSWDFEMKRLTLEAVGKNQVQEFEEFKFDL